MIKILTNVYNHVLDLYVFNLDNNDSVLISKADLANQAFESELEKHYHAVYDDNGSIIGFELQKN